MKQNLLPNSENKKTTGEKISSLMHFMC